MTETYGDWERPGTNPGSRLDPVARRDALRRNLDRLYGEVSRIETELGLRKERAEIWGEKGSAPFVVTGLTLGFVGAAASLLFHVIGSLALGRFPLHLIRVYLTFPLGDSALTLQTGIPLAAGTCLYLVVGAIYGILFHLVLIRWFADAPGLWRLLVVSALAIVIWLVNYYLILSWLQPLITGEASILSEVPFWLAAFTHLTFAWTILFVEGRDRSGALGRVRRA
jgi:hypothetical protein